MALGNYDHPAYLARLVVPLHVTTAGASGTSGLNSFPVPLRIRKVTATVRVAGTSAGSGHKVDVFVGTSSVGTIALNTLGAGISASSTDMDTLIPAGTKIYTVNGTDATGTAQLVAEMHIDPTTGTWS